MNITEYKNNCIRIVDLILPNYKMQFDFTKHDGQDYYEVFFLTEYCSISFYYEYRQPAVTCTIADRVNRNIFHEPVLPGKSIKRFYLDNIVPKNDRIYKMFDKEKYWKVDIEQKIKDQCILLKRYGKPFLQGDFSLLPEINIMIKRRAALYRLDRFGRMNAIENGWGDYLPEGD